MRSAGLESSGLKTRTSELDSEERDSIMPARQCSFAHTVLDVGELIHVLYEIDEPFARDHAVKDQVKVKAGRNSEDENQDERVAPGHAMKVSV